MVEIGSTVTVKVKNPLWERRSAYAYPIAEFQSYTGTVLPSPRWVGQDQLCLSTGDPSFPFRVIDRNRVVGDAMATAPEPVQSVWTIAGSKAGQTYLVTRKGTQWSCNCVGFGYRRTCSHVVEAKSLISNDFSETAKSLISKEKKTSKKSNKSALLNSRFAVESEYGSSTGVGSPKLERGNTAPYMMRLKMAKVEKHGDKTKIAIEVMEKNVGKTYDEVCELIAKAIGVPVARARVYYRHKVINKLAKGYENMSRPYPWEGKARAPKAAKAAKVAKTIAEKIVKAVEKSNKAVEKTATDVAAIKAKNLATLKAVSAKNRKVRDYGDRVAKPESDGVGDFDPALAREEVDAILRDERLIDVCPKFVREDA